MKAHAQKPELVFLRNGRVHLNRRGGQFSRLLDRPCSDEGCKTTGYPLHSHLSPSLPLPCVTVCRLIPIQLYFCFPVSVSLQQSSTITYLSQQLTTSLHNTLKQDHQSQLAYCHFGGKWCRKYLEDFRDIWRETWQQPAMADFTTCTETLRTTPRKKFGFINCDFLRGFVEIC